MTIFDNQRLYNIVYLNALALESYKLYEFQRRDKLFRNLKKELRTLLVSIRYDDLSLMTKKEVATLVKKVRTIHAGFYSQLSKEVLEMFDTFTEKNLVAYKRTWVPIVLAQEEDATETPDVVSEEEADKYIQEQGRGGIVPVGTLVATGAFLAMLSRTPISGVGLTFGGMLDELGESSRKKMEMEVMKAYATGGTTREDLIQALIGSDSIRQGANGVINTVQKQINGVIATGLEFSDAQAGASVASAISKTEAYVWVSVMDGRTSTICIELNRKIFKYGKGPLPPAHRGCRSKTMPWMSKEGPFEEVDHEDDFYKGISEYQKKHGIIDSTGKYKATTGIPMTAYISDLTNVLKRTN